MIPSKKSARFVGFLYLLLVIAGIFDLMYVRAKIMVKNNALETAGNLVANESLLRVDMVVGLFSTVIFVFVALTLYRLLKDVNTKYAGVMVILVLIPIAQSIVSQVLGIAALELAKGIDYLAVIDKPQRDAVALLCLRLGNKVGVLSEMYWGLWLLPLGLLVFRSRFIPRFIGVWLIVNGIAYVILSVTGLLIPESTELLFKLAFPAMLGELVLTLWLLIVGTRIDPVSIKT